MKILISDIDSEHANGLVPYIEAYHPDADITIRIESLADSVTYAIANEIPIICRATSGLSDSRIAGEGMDAWAGGVGIVHAHGDSTHTYQADPSAVGVICAVGHGDDTPENLGSYGPGLEFFAEENIQSKTTAMICGMIAELMTQRNEWDFHAARQALRQTASNWSFGDPDDGHVDDGGWGLVDWSAAQAVVFLERHLTYGEPNETDYQEENMCRALCKILPVPDADIGEADRWWQLGIRFPVIVPSGEPGEGIAIIEHSRFRRVFGGISRRIN